MKCIIHVRKTKNDTKVVELSKTSWKKVQECATRWGKLEGCVESVFVKESSQQWEEETVPEDCGYHSQCYNAFCNVTNIARKENLVLKAEEHSREMKERESETAREAPSTSRLLRSSNITGGLSTEKNLLPTDMCLICQKRDRFIKHHSRTIRCKLMAAVTEDGGNLMNVVGGRWRGPVPSSRFSNSDK